MAHDHSHQHGGGTKNLKIAFFINIGFTCLEIVGGFFTNSIAIISDALHDLGDSLSLGLAWYLEKKASQKGSTNRFSFGYARFRLLGLVIDYLAFIAKKETKQTEELWSFIPIRVVSGTIENEWIAVDFMDDINEKTLFAMNNAYYLLAELNKGEGGGHHH